MKKRILVAPLNWGLGHAARCIPIIYHLIDFGFEPILGSDGDALLLLQKEFPKLISIELPSYEIRYSKKASLFKLKMLRNSLKIFQAIKAEKELTQTIIEKYRLSGLISDNRLGVYSKKIPSAIITHQLNVLNGTTTWASTLWHRKFIRQFNECWIPDVDGNPNLSGNLGHVNNFDVPLKYIGPLSRFSKSNAKLIIPLFVLLSGPEPQRSLLEKILLSKLNNYPKKVVFVKGIMEKDQTVQYLENLTIYNFMTTKQLEKTLNESELVLSRSGYSTIMDLAKLGKKAFFIPTPGQSEQEYLANRLLKLNLVPTCAQDDFTLEKLEDIEKFKGLESLSFEEDFKALFSLFQGK